MPFHGDLHVPVMCVEAETDLIVLGYLPARQPDDDRLVTWEIAGTAHADVYTFGAGMIDTGAVPIAELTGRVDTHRRTLRDQAEGGGERGPAALRAERRGGALRPLGAQRCAPARRR